MRSWIEVPVACFALLLSLGEGANAAVSPPREDDGACCNNSHGHALVLADAQAKSQEKATLPTAHAGTSSAVRVAVIEPVICRGAGSCKSGEWRIMNQSAVFTLDATAMGIPIPNVRVLNTRFDCVDHCAIPSASVSDLEVLVAPKSGGVGVFETPPVAVRVKAPGNGEFRERWLISIIYLDDNPPPH